MKPRPTDNTHENLTRLAAGDLDRFAAWKLRRRIARDPAFAQEWKETRLLWNDLATLGTADATSPVPARPRWPDASPRRLPSPVITFGGWTMNRRAAFAALGAVSLCTITGALAARQMLFSPLLGRADRSGNVWTASPHFRGMVRMFDTSGKLLTTSGTDSAVEAGVFANVSVNGHQYPVRGAGRHPILDANGSLLGYAELVPQTAHERASWWAEHKKALGYEEMLSMPNGASDGYGIATGFLGGEESRLTWTLRGVGEVFFSRADNGHIIRRVHATPISDTRREQLKKELGTKQYVAEVAARVPEIPVFEWIRGDQKTRWEGFGTHQLVLPDGTVLNVQVRPFAQPVGQSASDNDQVARDKERGIDERLEKTSYGSTDGYGMTVGSFGEAGNRLSWEMRGVGEVRFSRADNGHVVMKGNADTGLPDAETRKWASGAGFTLPVDKNPPSEPVFTLTHPNGQTEHWQGFGTHDFVTPNGLHLRLQVLPREKH